MIIALLISLVSSAECNTLSLNRNVKDGILYLYYTKEINNECVLDGSWTEYFVDNGNIRSRGQYKNNKKDGHWFWNYHSGSRQMQGGFKDNEEDGYWIYFHKNGNRFMEGPKRAGLNVGQWMMFYEDGTVYAKTSWYKGDLEGDMVYYHPNGKKSLTGQFKDKKRFGKWTWWNEQGEITKEEVYD